MSSFKNPFARDETDAPRAKALATLSSYFEKKALEWSTSKQPGLELFASDEGHEWLMDQIDETLDKDELEDEDAAKLCALFFCLLVSNSDVGDGE